MVINELNQKELIDEILINPLIVKPNSMILDVIAQMAGYGKVFETLPKLDLQRQIIPQEARASCVLILEDSKILGIITESDVVRIILERSSLENLKISEVMSSPIITLHKSDLSDIFFGIYFLKRHEISHLPILDEENKLVGLLSYESLFAKLGRLDLLKACRVSEFMTNDFQWAVADVSMLEILRLMAEYQTSYVVIVQEETAYLSESLPIPIGIVNQSDIVQLQGLNQNLEKCQANCLLRQPIISVSVDDSLWVVQQIMQQTLTENVVVTGSQGEVVGVVTRNSLLQALNPLELYKLAERLQNQVFDLEIEKSEPQQNSIIELKQTVEKLPIKTVKGLETRNITEQNQLEAQLKDLSERLELAIQSAQIGIWEWDILQNRLIWDERMYELYSKDPSDFDGSLEAWLSTIHPNDRTSAEIATKRILEGDIDFKPEFRIVHPDGTIKFIKAYAIIHRDSADGHLKRMVGVNLDISELKEKELAIRQNEASLQLAQKIGHLGSWEWDLITQKVKWSDEMFCIFDKNPETFEPNYETFLNIVHPADRVNVEAFVNCLIKEKINNSVEYRIVHSNKTIRYIDCRAEFIFDEQGEIIKLYGICLDITERKQAETKYRRLIEHIPGIFYTSPITETNEYSYISPYIKKLLGVDQEEWCAGFFNTWKHYVHPEDLEPVIQKLQRNIETNEGSFQAEYRMIDRNGKIVWVRDIASLVLADDHLTPILQGVAVDITEIKQAEAILQFQAQILEQIHDAVISVDPSGIVQTWNQGAEKLYGYSVNEAIGQSISFLYFPEDLEQMQSRVFGPLLTKGSHETELRNRTKSGEEIYISLRLSVMRDESGKIIRLIGCSNDITDKKRSNELLNLLNQELEQRIKERTAALEQSEARLKEAQFTARLGSWECNLLTGKICWSPEMFNIFGFDPNQSQPTYEKIIEHLSENAQEQYKQVINRAVQFGESYAIDLKIIRGDGSFGYIFTKGKPIFNVEGKVIGLHGIAMDISDRKLAELALLDSERRYTTLAATVPVAIYRFDELGNCIYVNNYWSKMTGRPIQEALKNGWIQSLHPEDREPLVKKLFQNSAPSNLSFAEGRIVRTNGTIRWFYMQILPENDSNGTFIGYIGTATDMTEMHQAQEVILHNTLHDPLTGLPNRRLLLERIELAMNRSKRQETYGYALLFIDLDRFKVINDSLGHVAGDQLLQIVAQKLTNNLRCVDLVARLGGDEFVILLEDVSNFEEVIQITERLLRNCQKPVKLNQYEIFISLSIGVVFKTKDYTNASDLLRDADLAMYRAKSNGKNGYVIFDEEMHLKAIQQLSLETDVRKALKAEEFILYYQPIFDIVNNRLLGFEALVRWQHPTRGLVSPAQFIPLAEEIGLIVSLNRWILHRACQQLAIWQTKFAHLFPLKMSINLSAQDLRQPDLIDDIDRAIAQTGLDANNITLEITESMLIENVNETINLLNQLRARKIQISIDDFGTGYSSLNYLHRLPANNLKIDRSFVSNMSLKNYNYQIVNTIITLSKQLGLAVIAEGIETPQQLGWLQELGCKIGQGYLLSKPLTAQEIETKFLFKSQFFSL